MWLVTQFVTASLSQPLRCCLQAHRGTMFHMRHRGFHAGRHSGVWHRLVHVTAPGSGSCWLSPCSPGWLQPVEMSHPQRMVQLCGPGQPMCLLAPLCPHHRHKYAEKMCEFPRAVFT